MILGVPTATTSGERRVALVPAVAAELVRKGHEVLIEIGAGMWAGFTDAEYQQAGAQCKERSAVLGRAETLLTLHGIDPASLRRGPTLIGMLDPLGKPETTQSLAEQGVTAFALELLPRITRAQSMDVLSSMATVAGYKAVLEAAVRLNKMFPLLMTAAGTVVPAHVFVIGAGVAGLQAIATAHRLGAVVQAYDVRPEVREQVESVGAKFADLGLANDQAAESGGYAQPMDDEFYRQQQARMEDLIAQSDVVITTAAIPGRPAPRLVPAAAVRRMRPGSVIVDLAAESGGNCELTQPGTDVIENGVTIVGPRQLAASLPYHASQLYAKNIAAFVVHLSKAERIEPEMSDELLRETLVAFGGKITNAKVRERLAGEK